MFIKNNINKPNNADKDENLNTEKIFFSILAICLTIIIIINTIQLFYLIDNIKEINETLKTFSTNFEDYKLQQELKTSYTIQLVKLICTLVAEFSGLILSIIFLQKINNKFDTSEYIDFNTLYDNLDEDALAEELAENESNKDNANKHTTTKHKK